MSKININFQFSIKIAKFIVRLNNVILIIIYYREQFLNIEIACF